MPSVYTYVGVTSPAGASSHKALSGEDAALPAPDTGAEGSQANYDAIEASDDVRWTCASNTGIPYKQFRIYAPDAGALVSIAVLAEGKGGSGVLGWSYELWAYNNDTTAWEQRASHTNSTEAQISDTISVNPAYYRNGSNYIWIATTATAGYAEYSSSLIDDFVQVTVTTGGSVYDETGKSSIVLVVSSEIDKYTNKETGKSSTVLVGTSEVEHYLNEETGKSSTVLISSSEIDKYINKETGKSATIKVVTVCSDSFNRKWLNALDFLVLEGGTYFNTGFPFNRGGRLEEER